MPFYHDKQARLVKFAPTEPTVHHKKGKHGEPGIWNVSVQIEVTRADNYLLSNTHDWAYPLLESYSDQYCEIRDTRDAAIKYFKKHYFPSLPKIEKEEYFKLRNLYEKQAETNKKPKK